MKRQTTAMNGAAARALAALAASRIRSGPRDALPRRRAAFAVAGSSVAESDEMKK
jgi:hypothetical protein